jgi:hypothetical protein
MFVIDERYAESKGSINKQGHFRTDSTGLVVEVKDTTRYPDKWVIRTRPIAGFEQRQA